MNYDTGMKMKWLQTLTDKLYIYQIDQETTNTKEIITYNSIYIKLKIGKIKLCERKVGAIIGIKKYGNILFLDLSNGNTNTLTL